MKKIILILTIFFFFQLTYAQVVEVQKKYYSVTNEYLKILKLKEGELIFYGGYPRFHNLDGAILRTYDNGKTFEQNYPGTNHFIPKLIYHNKIVYGVTAGGEFMASSDKGDYWNVIKIDTVALYGLIEHDDVLYVLSDGGRLLISYDFGDTWVTKELNNVKGQNLSLSNGIFIITDYNDKNTISYSKDKGETWHNLFLDFEFYLDKNIDNEYYLTSGNKIYKFNEEFQLDTIEIPEIQDYFNFTVINDKFIISNMKSISQRVNSIELLEFDINSKNLKLISTYQNNSLGYSAIERHKYFTIDLTFSNNEYILSNPYKTILKYNANDNWELLSTYTPQLNGRFIIESNNWFFQNNETGAHFKSTNQGITFYNTKPSLIYQNDDSIKSPIRNITFKDSKNALVNFSSLGVNQKNQNISYPKVLGFTDDGCENIYNLDLFKLNKYFYDYEILSYYDNNYYVSRSLKQTTKERGVNNAFEDSVYNLDLFRINSETYEMDSLTRIVDSLQFTKIYFDDDNKIWLFGKNAINFNQIKIFQSTDNGNTFNLVFSIPCKNSENPEIFIKNKKGDYYLILSETVLKLSLNDFSFAKVDLEYTHFGVYDKNNNKGYLEDKLLTFLKVENNQIMKRDLGYVEFNPKINIKITEEINRFFPIFAQFDDSKYYSYFTGISTLLYRPIEPERLEYYSSVQKTETRNYLWTYPPYPQPTNNIVKIDTYWDSGLPFTEKDIEIYDLTGIKINTENTLTVQKESIYKGHIIWDASSYKTGIYIMKITHGTETRVRKIMVVE